MDGLLVLMVIAWGANYSLLKRAFEEMPPAAFNTLRMGFSSAGVSCRHPDRARRQAGRSAAAPSSVFYTPHRADITRSLGSRSGSASSGTVCYQLCLRRRSRAHDARRTPR